MRFIPAWAGNTIEHVASIRYMPVHPRVGGGTHYRILFWLFWRRFIPAWAGNTARRRLNLDHMAVHPRVGGEHRHFCASV